MANSSLSVNSFKTAELWLWATAASLATIHLTLLWRAEQANLLGMSALFWIALSYLVWQKRQRLNLNSDLFSSCLGASLIAWGLVKSLSIAGYDPFLRFLPLLDVLGLTLLASGLRGIGQYWQVFCCLCFLLLPPSLVGRAFDPSWLTAKFSAFILWYLGFNLSLDDTVISLPSGSVNVYLGCAGLDAMIHLLGVSCIFLALFPLKGWLPKILVPLVALALAFVTNGFRVALMAVFVNLGNQQAFDYWHEGDGSLVFSLIAILLLGTFCLYLIRRESALAGRGAGG